jgi:hypothetical protein
MIDRVHLHTLLLSELDEDKWSASLTGLPTPGEKAPYSHWIRD